MATIIVEEKSTSLNNIKVLHFFFCCITFDNFHKTEDEKKRERLLNGSQFSNFIHLQLWKRIEGSDEPPAHLDSSWDYNVYMIPKGRFLREQVVLISTL